MLSPCGPDGIRFRPAPAGSRAELVEAVDPGRVPARLSNEVLEVAA
ncbi:hypothetical protein [Micromonospora sp. NPDC092111]